MPVSPHLHRKLQETLGVDAAADLVTLIEEMDGLRGDMGELRHEMQLGFSRLEARLAVVETRLTASDRRQSSTETRLDAVLAGLTRLEGSVAAIRPEMTALMERGLREQTRFFFLAWSVLVAAIIGLYAR